MNTIQVVNIIFFFFYCYSQHATIRCNLPQDSNNKIKKNNVNTIQDVHITFFVSSITPNIYMVVTVTSRKNNMFKLFTICLFFIYIIPPIIK